MTRVSQKWSVNWVRILLIFLDLCKNVDIYNNRYERKACFRNQTNNGHFIVAIVENGKTLFFKAGNLTLLEIVQQLNKVVLPLVPPPQDLSASIPQTKSQKKKK